MAQGTGEQLKNTVYAEFCCLYDDNLIFEAESAELKFLLGMDSGENLCGKNLFDIIPESDKIKTEVGFQLKDGNDLEILIVTCEGNWILIKGVQTVCDGISYVRGVFVSISKFKNIFQSQQIKLDEYRDMLVEFNEKVSKDSLTMVLNAKTTRTLCEEYVANSEKSFALMVIDIDNFKKINDVYGHIVGDKVLLFIADTLKKLFRNNDIVGRIGGDEFLVLMKDVNDKEIVVKRSSQIVASINSVELCEISSSELSCSVGVSFVNSKCGNYDEIFRIADKAMYSAKGNGGNRFEIYEI